MSEATSAATSNPTPPIASPTLEADAGSSHDHATAKASGSTALTAKQSAYVELDRKFSAEIKPFLDALKAAKDAVVDECGIGIFFQDVEGTVYHTAPKKGQWVDFTAHEIQRTRREGEAKGTLSLTAAKEAGFEVS